MTFQTPRRVTKPTLAIAQYLNKLKNNSTWGLQICSETGLGSGSVYSVLDRFEGYGWVESYWEEDNSRRGARRRLYRVTPIGRSSLKKLLTENSEPLRKVNPKNAKAIA